MAMQGWTDEFDGAQLNGRWRWHAPAGGSYALQDGWLVLINPLNGRKALTTGAASLMRLCS